MVLLIWLLLLYNEGVSGSVESSTWCWC